MKENVILFQSRAAVAASTPASNPSPTVKAESIRIEVLDGSNNEQYERVVKSYDATNGAMDFEDIARAGEELGDKVLRIEAYAHLRPGWQQQKSGVMKKEGTIVAWQTRDRTESITPELPSPQSVSHQEVSIVPKNLTIIESRPEQTVEVIEGIQVSLKQDTSSALEDSTKYDQEREDNPYLKKAA